MWWCKMIIRKLWNQNKHYFWLSHRYKGEPPVMVSSAMGSNWDIQVFGKHTCKTRILRFSRLTCSQYLQNIQRGPPLGVLTNQNRYANEVLSTCMRIRWRPTTRVVLVSITTHTPSFIKVAHTELWIFDFVVISQSEQICKWGIKYAHLVMTDHVGSTCTHHYLHTKFHQCSPYRKNSGYIWLFCY